MKINRISWQNYRGLADGEIIADGQDVIVGGQNGAGKSSIASILPFVLFGEGASTVKQFDDGLIPTDDGGVIHTAQIDFDDGTTFRREYFWNGKANRSSLFINGKSVKTAEFNAKVYDLTHGVGGILLNPFVFCALPVNDRRNLLLKIFGSDVSVSDAEFNDIPNVLAGLSPEKFLADAKRELKSLKADAAIIPAKIDENKRNLEKFPPDIDAELQRVQAQLDNDIARRDKLAKQKDFNYDLALAQKQLADFAGDKNFAQRQVDTLNITRQQLLNEYHALKNSKCPTCGQKIISDPARIQIIIADGKKIADDIKSFQQQIAECDSKIADTQEKIKVLSAKAQDNLFGSELALIDKSVADLSARLSDLRTAKNIHARINELQDQSKSVADDINQLEQDIKFVERYLHRKIELLEAHINSNFEFVNFKLFNVAITTGELTPTCEATLHGVPYSALSKGERFKAAFDILNTLQAHFNAELPLFIDDAESYTANSFVELPNQIWLFKVTDENQLNIKTVSDRLAA